MRLHHLALFSIFVFFSVNAYSVTTRYDAIKSLLLNIAAKYPQNAKMIVVGDSDSGVPIVGLQIGQGSVANLIVATHHGNEYGSTYVATAFANHLAAQPLPDQAVFIIPVLNIAGYNANQRREPARNATWDPNRNYPGPCGTEGPFTLKSTASLDRFIADKKIVNSVTLHTHAEMILYPWGLSTKDVSTSYDYIYKQLGLLAAQESKYTVGNSTELLYPADGTYEDYSFWKYGIWSLLIEIGTTHSPSQEELKQWASVNVPGLKRLLQMAPKARAVDHAFKGKCDTRFRSLDRHDE